MSQAVDSSASALAGSRELLAAVLAHLGDGIVVHAPNGERLYANDAAARLTGFASAEELLAATPAVALARFDVFHPDGTPMRPDELPGRRALAGEEPAPTLVRFRAVGGGSDRVSQVTAVPVRDAQGELLYVIIHFRDVTEEPVFAAEAAGALENASLYREAKRTSALLDSLYNSAPIGLGFWDRDLRYVRVNNALAVINERPSEDHPGRTFAEVVPHLAPALESIARRVLETSEPVTALEMVAGTPSDPTAQRFWLTSYYPVLDRDGEALGVGAVIEEVTDRRRAEQRTELQHLVTRILSAADAVDTAVTRVLETVCEALGWDVGCYWPLDPEEPRVTWARAGVRAEGFLEMTRRMPLSAALLPGRVAESGEAEWLDHLSPPTFPRASVAEAEGLSSGVGFPILIEGRVGGVLEIFSLARRPRDAEIELTLVAIGGQLGQFLRRKRAEDERLQLLQRERQARAEAESAAATLRKLARVSEVALDRIGLNDLLDALLARIAEVLDADTAAILLLGGNDELGVRATFGLADALEHARTIPLGAGLAGRVAASRAPAVIADLAEVELVSPVLRERGVNSLVAIPLIADDAVIGVVHAGSEAYANFTDDDARLLELIAERIALAIRSAALIEAERAAQERLAFLSEASVALSSSLDLETTLRRTAQLATQRFADAAVVDLVDGGSIARVVIEVAEGRISSEVRDGLLANPPSPEDDGGSARVIRTGLEEVLADLDTDPAPLAAVIRGRPAAVPTLELFRPRALVYVPLRARDRILGVLALIRISENFTTGDVETVRELAARAAVAVDNAHLYREAEEQAQAARVLASVGDGVFFVDRRGIVRTWNRAAASATRLPEADVLGRAAVEAIPGWASI